MCRRSAFSRRISLPARVECRRFARESDSRDHSPDVYEEIIIPGFRAMNPAPSPSFLVHLKTLMLVTLWVITLL